MALADILQTNITIEQLVTWGSSLGLGTWALSSIKDGSFLKLISGFSKWANKKYSEVKMTAVLNEIRSNPEFETFNAGLTKKVKFEIEKDLHLSDLQDGETVLIALDTVKNTPANITKSVIQYVSQSLLSKGQVTLNPDLKKGVTYMVSRGVLNSQKLLAARDYFDCEVLTTEYKQNSEFEKIISELETIDKFGFLTRVLLQQFYELNKIDVDPASHTKIKEETHKFFKFLHRICIRKEFDDTTPIKFDGVFIKARVFLVTSSRSVREGGSDKLFKNIQNQVNYDYIYLICPAINENMKERSHLPAWEIYNDTLSLFEKKPSIFFKAKSQKFSIKTASHKATEIGITFLIRNG
jgi:hypothetical protein